MYSHSQEVADSTGTSAGGYQGPSRESRVFTQRPIVGPEPTQDSESSGTLQLQGNNEGDALKVRLRQTIFDRWIIVHPELDDAAWTGSRWQSISKDGLPTGPHAAQVSNLATEQEAAEYAAKFGFETV